ncbi:hypothetical protein K1719_045857 [Acacia pycnantha]|nr:hypothetical protein K1719_045857 [Acacia pycnantha]
MEKEKQYEEQFMRLFEEMKEAAAATSTDSQVKENRCLNVFKLIKICLVNYLYQVSTQVGRDLRVLTKHPSMKIQACAMDLLNKWGSFNSGAKSIKIKYRSLMFNLNDPNNPDFRRRVLLGEFKPEQLVNMKTEDMASDERKKEIENIIMKALFKCEHGQKRKATTDQFVCGKCRKRKESALTIRCRPTVFMNL